jgi:hypothetical protein
LQRVQRHRDARPDHHVVVGLQGGQVRLQGALHVARRQVKVRPGRVLADHHLGDRGLDQWEPGVDVGVRVAIRIDLVPLSKLTSPGPIRCQPGVFTR